MVEIALITLPILFMEEKHFKFQFKKKSRGDNL